MQYNNILTSLENNILIITINRPDKLNALNKDVFTDLKNVLQEIKMNDEIRSAIITGSGNKAFVAGADISEFGNLSVEEGKKLAKRGQDIFDELEASAKPIIAAVNGFALGGGCELALACHFIIASENAKFGQPEVNLGLIPGYGGTQRLVQLTGKNRAMQLLMTGEMINATDAMHYGIVNKVVKQEELIAEVKNILQTIHTKAPIAIAKVIECVNNFDHDQQGYDFEIEKFGECFGTADMKEGAAAFIEKRKANFTGK